jgi:putative spermidine/putrescine transport system permease protein
MSAITHSDVAATSGPGRRLARWLHAHPRAGLFGLLSAPAAWLLVAYLVSLASLLLVALYRVNGFTFAVEKVVGLDNLNAVYTGSTFWKTTGRTVLVAAQVTILCLLIALPMAFAMAKLVRPSMRRALVVALLMPLWASYLVKGYAWKAILDPASGVLEKTIGVTPGFTQTATVIVLAYLWLPYMVLPIYAGLERLPGSMLEASADLGGKAGRTFWSVVLPQLVPSMIAGSIFTFSLSLGDYIAVGIVGGPRTQLIGNLIYRNFGANDVPLAAAFATVPVLIMVIYLLAVRRTGALENL